MTTKSMKTTYTHLCTFMSEVSYQLLLLPERRWTQAHRCREAGEARASSTFGRNIALTIIGPPQFKNATSGPGKQGNARVCKFFYLPIGHLEQNRPLKVLFIMNVSM